MVGVGFGVPFTQHKAPCAVRQISLGFESQKNKNEKQKQTLVKDVRTLSTEEPNELRAIGNLDRPYWGWDRRRAPRKFSLQCERKTQNSIKQQNKDDEWWMNDWPKNKRPNSRLFFFGPSQSWTIPMVCGVAVQLNRHLPGIFLITSKLPGVSSTYELHDFLVREFTPNQATLAPFAGENILIFICLSLCV